MWALIWITVIGSEVNPPSTVLTYPTQVVCEEQAASFRKSSKKTKTFKDNKEVKATHIFTCARVYRGED